MRLGAIVIDTNNPEELSDFYAKLLGWSKNIQIHNEEKWITVIKDDYSETPLVFQNNPEYISPKWPSETNKQQQMLHLDFYVNLNEYEEKVEYAIKCGAKLVGKNPDDNWEVLLDPAGHPFCIIPIPKEIYKQRYK